MCGINITISRTQEYIWILPSNQSSQKILTKENSSIVDIKEKLYLTIAKQKLSKLSDFCHRKEKTLSVHIEISVRIFI
jgi:hypothetical protein